MQKITYITGNPFKADYLARFLGIEVNHKKINLDEIQSLELSDVIEYKAKQAYSIVKSPVLVEDTSLEFTALGRMPGTFIKFFWEELGAQYLCDMLEGKDRSATAKCTFGFYDGKKLKLIGGELKGSISHQPTGDNGFGWDKIFIAENNTVTRASLSDDDYEASYKSLKPFAELKSYLNQYLLEG